MKRIGNRNILQRIVRRSFAASSGKAEAPKKGSKPEREHVSKLFRPNRDDLEVREYRESVWEQSKQMRRYPHYRQRYLREFHRRQIAGEEAVVSELSKTGDMESSKMERLKMAEKRIAKSSKKLDENELSVKWRKELSSLKWKDKRGELQSDTDRYRELVAVLNRAMKDFAVEKRQLLDASVHSRALQICSSQLNWQSANGKKRECFLKILEIANPKRKRLKERDAFWYNICFDSLVKGRFHDSMTHILRVFDWLCAERPLVEETAAAVSQTDSGTKSGKLADGNADNAKQSGSGEVHTSGRHKSADSSHKSASESESGHINTSDSGTAEIEGTGKRQSVDSSRKRVVEDSGIGIQHQTLSVLMKAVRIVGKCDLALVESITSRVKARWPRIHCDRHGLTEMIAIYGANKEIRKCEECFYGLRTKDVTTFGAMLNAYAECGMVAQMHSLIKNEMLAEDSVLPKTELKLMEDNVAIFGSLMKGYLNAGEYSRTIRTFYDLISNPKRKALEIHWNMFAQAYCRKIKDAIIEKKALETAKIGFVAKSDTVIGTVVENGTAVDNNGAEMKSDSGVESSEPLADGLEEGSAVESTRHVHNIEISAIETRMEQYLHKLLQTIPQMRKDDFNLSPTTQQLSVIQLNAALMYHSLIDVQTDTLLLGTDNAKLIECFDIFERFLEQQNTGQASVSQLGVWKWEAKDAMTDGSVDNKPMLDLHGFPVGVARFLLRYLLDQCSADLKRATLDGSRDLIAITGKGKGALSNAIKEELAALTPPVKAETDWKNSGRLTICGQSLVAYFYCNQ